jgi:hypothetical protein
MLKIERSESQIIENLGGIKPNGLNMIAKIG